MSSFATLGVKKPFIESIKELGINTPSEIQQKTIPILLDKRTEFYLQLENWYNKLKNSSLNTQSITMKRCLLKPFMVEKR